MDGNSRIPENDRAARSASVQSFYRWHARIYDWTRWAVLFGRREAIRLLGLRRGDTVLEIGCGTGLNLPALAAAVGRTGRVVGVDFSPEMLRRARRSAARTGWPHVELLRRDADRLDLARQFDAVLFAYSLRMIPDWRAALAQAVAHLRPGGRVVVLDFGAFEGWPAVLRRAAGAYLRWNHVRTDYPLAQAMNDVLDWVEVRSHAGGYWLVARGCKPDAAAASA